MNLAGFTTTWPLRVWYCSVEGCSNAVEDPRTACGDCPSDGDGNGGCPEDWRSGGFPNRDGDCWPWGYCPMDWSGTKACPGVVSLATAGLLLMVVRCWSCFPIAPQMSLPAASNLSVRHTWRKQNRLGEALGEAVHHDDGRSSASVSAWTLHHALATSPGWQ